MKLVSRGGRYYRVVNPRWVDPLDASFSKTYGGRWTPPGEFGALYLCATVDVAAANARYQHRNRAIQLFDLRPEARPSLVMVNVPENRFLDVVSDAGVAALRLPRVYPFGVAYERCWPIARRAYRERVPGVACRSNAEATSTDWIGEELALFDFSLPVRKVGKTKSFAQWYPDADPDRR
jgi:hypothetical protein